MFRKFVNEILSFVQRRKISNETINETPFIVYPDCTKSECLVLKEISKKLLKLSRKYNLSREVCFIFSLRNLNDFWIGFGLTNNVKISRTRKVRKLLFFDSFKNDFVAMIHNHPNCTTFSLNDISLFVCSNIALSIVLGNNGDIYYLKKTDNYDAEKAMKKILDICYNIEHKKENTGAEKFLAVANSFGVNYGIIKKEK